MERLKKFLECVATLDKMRGVIVSLVMGTLTFLGTLFGSIGSPPFLNAIGSGLITLFIICVCGIGGFVLLRGSKSYTVYKVWLLSALAGLFLFMILAAIVNHVWVVRDESGQSHVVGMSLLDNMGKIRKEAGSEREFHRIGNYDMDLMYSSGSLVITRLLVAFTWYGQFVAFGLMLGVFCAWYHQVAKNIDSKKTPSTPSK